MSNLLKSLVFGTSMLALSHPVSAQATEQTCRTKDRSDTVVLMFCPSPLGEQAWIEAAKSACGVTQLCNVWIWDDQSKMPKKAPKTDAELSKAHTSAAVAVWINDSQSLMKLRKVR